MPFKANNMYYAYCVRVNVFALSIYTREKYTWIYDSTSVGRGVTKPTSSDDLSRYTVDQII